VSRIHDAAAVGFARGAEAYELGRPGYPAEALEALRLSPDLTVLDLAAGTGKLTRPLAASGARVIAVEPVAEMRAALPPSVEALDGTAESIPLGDGSVDLVTVAQAFHWFDGDAALAEIARVVRPAGRLVLVWNVRDRTVDWVAAVDEIIDRYRGDVPTHYSGRWRDAFARTDSFTPLEEHVVPYDQMLDVDGFVDRFASVSVIAALDDEERGRVETELRALVGGFDQPFALPHRTAVYWCSRR